VVNVFFAPHTYGGATIVAEEVSKSLVRRHGARVTVVSAMSRADVEPYGILRTEMDGIQNYLINLPLDRSYVDQYMNARASECIAMIAQDIEPDLAHVHCVQDIGADCIPTLKRLGIPVVLSTHDFWWLCERQFMLRGNGVYCGQDPVKTSECRGCVDDFGRMQARSRTLSSLANAADVVTFPSDFAKGLHERSGIGVKNGRVWRNGVQKPDADFFVRQSNRRARDKRLVFGFVGGPSQMKGWPLMRDAFRSLERDDFSGLLVDGSLDGSWWKGRDIGSLQGEWAVYPRYKQTEIDTFYAEIDVLLFLSQWKETFGLTVREAIARGIQVIQTDSGGTIEHSANERVRMLPIGCSVPALQGEIRACLDAPTRGIEPSSVRSYDDQADEFQSIFEGALPKSYLEPLG
jgi:glycosyltransferase involved in cell wall biosynthesis